MTSGTSGDQLRVVVQNISDWCQMRIAVLSPKSADIAEAFEQTSDHAVVTTEPIDASFVRANGIDFIVSYGYRHILSLDTLSAAPKGNCNLHISMLPWNRGADPNFWSWVDGTPKGVTIHRMNKGLDTGPIYCQEAVSFTDDDTLSTSYGKLSFAMRALFIRNWPAIRGGMLWPQMQADGGSYHRSADKADIWARLPLGFDTRCSDLRASQAVMP